VLLVATYGWLVLASTITAKFAIYGRTTRPIAPFLCLLAAYALARLTVNRKGWRNAAIGLVLIGATLNFIPHLTVVFPGELYAKVQREFGVPKMALSFSGPLRMAPSARVTRPDLALVNATQLFPIREFIGDPAGVVLFELTHPLALKCYQYEGSLPADRELLRQHGAWMKLIRLADPASVPDIPPASLTTAPSYLGQSP
jgi:hypothetical protein